jgi:CRP/FNR family cyclic AMP-dependent transcriptional regulator
LSTDQDKIVTLLTRTPPFTGAAEADIAALAAACSLHRFAPKTVVFSEGDRATAGWLIVSGRVRILIFAGGTRTLQAESLGPGELFGLYCRLGSRSPHTCTAVAEGALTAVRIPDRAFEALTHRSLVVSRCTTERCAERIRMIRNLVRFGRESVHSRVVATLLSLRSRFGDTIPATRHEMATWVGASQETVFRELAVLRGQRILRTERGRIILLDAKKLQRASVESEP